MMTLQDKVAIVSRSSSQQHLASSRAPAYQLSVEQSRPNRCGGGFEAQHA